ncbi:unnamed protein product, partial [marine sediment metagenome]
INQKIHITTDMILERLNDMDEFLFNQLKYMFSYRLLYGIIRGRHVFTNMDLTSSAKEFKKIDK